ncbi:hypothetical protein A5658_08675 [Mycobacterium sp. 1245111.1]|uniref:DUF3349 domain-containing protein n=1 Tax=Mycobacterium sp. 1245111.1 TaxID=1834073 RepID=UPI000800CF42|nr:DUF3349 domain-containing protein [Mycobacterium sp. 1245111.1]OBK35457.1 hypothetical protein A5658_08675 [Mycobacterium sp. 1245111.1]
MSLRVRVLDFLRAGYPATIAGRGFIPLLALCRRRLSDDEVSTVADELMVAGNVPVDGADVHVAITKLVDDLPSLEDVRRVNERLVRGGWSVTDVFRSSN